MPARGSPETPRPPTDNDIQRVNRRRKREFLARMRQAYPPKHEPKLATQLRWWHRDQDAGLTGRQRRLVQRLETYFKERERRAEAKGPAAAFWDDTFWRDLKYDRLLRSVAREGLADHPIVLLAAERLPALHRDRRRGRPLKDYSPEDLGLIDAYRAMLACDLSQRAIHRWLREFGVYTASRPALEKRLHRLGVLPVPTPSRWR
jgi:hypothetical protein